MGKNEPSDDPDPSEYLLVSLEQKRKDQTKPYDGKKMVWVPDPEKCFLLGEIQSTKGDVCTVSVKGEEVRCELKFFFKIIFPTFLKIKLPSKFIINMNKR